mgnify:CR=1 FL=1
MPHTLKYNPAHSNKFWVPKNFDNFQNMENENNQAERVENNSVSGIASIHELESSGSGIERNTGENNSENQSRK